MTPLMWRETQQVRRHKADRIIPSRFHLRLKTIDAPGGSTQNHREVQVDSYWVPRPGRLCVGGRKPMSTVNLKQIVPFGLRRTWGELFAGDVVEAFLQGDPI